jgi:long-chain fatty acid transport protein
VKYALQFAASILTIVLLFFLTLVPPASATNGMNMEGYGPIATGMGGASMAYDNGTAAVMNNPATLGLMPEGNRLDVLLGTLGPDIQTSVPGAPAADSTADLFIMPALGWAQKKGPFAYGIGVFAQGGMGTQYNAGTWPTFGSPDKVRSELGVGRAIIPVAYNATKDLTIAASFDYVWASLDVQMALPGSQFVRIVTGCAGPACGGLGGFTAATWARIDFTDGGADNGSARGTGFAGKLGATYRIGPQFTVGATYHSKTYLNDLETSTTGAVLNSSFGPVGIGKIKVLDFQWPETYGLGVAWTATERLMVAADYKRINWHNVMKDFRMSYEGTLPGSSVNTVNFAIPQNWNNQNVYELGAAYKFTREFTGRIGVNISDNPIPDTYLNYLFPATIKNHYTIGAGYAFTKASSLDLSVVYAPRVSATTPDGVTTTHSQGNAQVMYSCRF